MNPKFLRGCATAHEEVEALAAMSPGAPFWADLTSDILAVEEQQS